MKIGANRGRVLIGGRSYSADVRSVTVAATADPVDVTTLASTGREHILGDVAATVSLDGMFDTSAAAGGQHATFESTLGAVDYTPVTVAPAGFTPGNPCWSMDARHGAYMIAGKVGDAVAWRAEMTGEGQTDFGESLQDLTAVTATGNGATVDGSAGTTDGAGLTLHVTANDRDGDTTIKVQHSTDGTTWADLATFAAVAAGDTTAERVATTGTVARYLRAVRTLAGTTGSVTFTVTAARH